MDTTQRLCTNPEDIGMTNEEAAMIVQMKGGCEYAIQEAE